MKVNKYKSTACPICNGRGFTTQCTENSISSFPCVCHDGLTYHPKSCIDLIRECDSETLVKILYNLKNTAIYSGGSRNRLLMCNQTEEENREDLLLWLNKIPDKVDMTTIFNDIELVSNSPVEPCWIKEGRLNGD